MAIDPEMIKAACRAEDLRNLDSTELEAQPEKQAASSAALTQVAWQYKPPDFSDAGNSAAFVRWVSGKLLYCPALGWIVWTGQNWESADHIAVSFATQYTDALLEDAIKNYGAVARSFCAGSQEERAAKAYLSHAQRTRSKRSIDAFLKLSASNLHVELEALDADGYKLNCPSGLIDLRTGIVIDHAPEQLTMKMTACSPSAQGADEWDAFLDDITCGDPSIKAYLQDVAGMAAVGKVLTETAVFLVGGGRNGKSTWLNAIAAVLGTYSRTMDISVLTTVRQQRGAAFAELKGRRLVYAGELEQGARLSVSTLKQLCSTDKITGERKYCAPAEFTPSHSLILCSNYLPKVGANDEGCWRRISVVPFRADFKNKKEIKNYASALVKRAGGAILQWIVDGAIRFIRNGGRLYPPAVVLEETKRYRDSEDWLQNFIDECCNVGFTTNPIKTSVLYDAYREYARNTENYCRRVQEFTSAMESKGFERKLNHGARFWTGISLRQRYTEQSFNF